MQSLKIVPTLAVALVVVFCGYLVAASPSLQLAHEDYEGLRILGGQQAESQAAPHQVSLRRKQAHCTIGYTPDIFVAVVGTLTLDKGGDYYDIEKIINHEFYSPEMILNDIALLKVQKEFQADAPYKPIALCDSNTPADVRLRITGWGLTSFPGKVSNHLMSIDIKSISNMDCIVRLTGDKEHPPISLFTHLCAVNAKGQGTCMGDSGGGLVDVAKNQLCGVVSWGIPCALDLPDVYTRVYSHVAWIKEKMAQN